MSRPSSSRDPGQWQVEIDRSIAEYNEWYLGKAPGMWIEARGRATGECKAAMEALSDFRDVSAETLMFSPRALAVIRMAISPTMARERFAMFVGVTKNFVEKMERDGVLPPRTPDPEGCLRRICEFVNPILDPVLFPWIAEDRKPTAREREDALLVLGDRRANATYGPVLRNSQEARQKALMREFLESHGFDYTEAAAFEMPPGTFRFGRTVRLPTDDGKHRNLPCDCIVAPLDPALPLACVEMKSAGDATNVNKRRKEESEKHSALSVAFGKKTVFLLQLFGYFNAGYLRFEREAGLDWAWDHTLADLAPYFGIEA
jgi:hypothetical protein